MNSDTLTKTGMEAKLSEYFQYGSPSHY